MTEWFLCMSQYRFAISDFVSRAQAAEAVQFRPEPTAQHRRNPLETILVIEGCADRVRLCGPRLLQAAAAVDR